MDFFITGATMAPGEAWRRLVAAKAGAPDVEIERAISRLARAFFEGSAQSSAEDPAKGFEGFTPPAFLVRIPSVWRAS